MSMKPIIPEDIQESAQDVIKALAGTDFTDSERRAVAIMVCFGMAKERYRCADIVEQFDPEIAARIWRSEE